MLKYVAYVIVGTQIGRVTEQVNNPWPEITETRPEGFFVETIPQPETREGFIPVLMVKLPGEEGEPELYYDYEVVPPTPETQLDRLSREFQETKSAVDDLTVAMVEFMMGGE